MTIIFALNQRTDAIKNVGDSAEELLEYFYANMGLTKPPIKEEEKNNA